MKPRRLLVPLLVLVLATIAVAGARYRVEPANCTGCGDCERLCPVGAIQVIDGKSRIDPETCIGCGQCLGVCTHDAIR
ncbi:4Fe-4S binding protein [Candidatus Fermentibacteria bacterium]|nr:4Fe-4S binding protein [Candidatus Fermentibacteria bacterium]